jgi:peptidoglycan/LPS O-acetylase OafA/YrhL
MYGLAVARRRPSFNCSQRGETATAHDTSLGLGLRLAIPVVRLHCLLLAPWIVLSIPLGVFFGLGILIVFAIVIVGLLGMFTKRQRLASFASVALLAMIIAGKVGTDLIRAAAPDTLVLLVQFVAVIFFMEASRVILSFDRESEELGGKMDEVSQALRYRLDVWVGGQLSRQARLIVGALGLSLLLLVLGGLTSVSVNEPVLSALLVILVVVVLLFLITQRREPETRPVRLS